MLLSEMNVVQQKKVLLYGDSGTGKTVFACGWPTPIYVADFDGKATSAASFYANDAERLNAITVDRYQKKPGDAADRPFVRYNTKLVELEKLAAAPEPFPFATIVVDSLTTYVDQMMEEIMVQNPGIQRQRVNMALVPAQQDYRILTIHFKGLLMRLLQLPANIVVTAHIKVDKDEMTGEILRNPALPGQLSSYLPVVFEEVYRTFAESRDGKQAYNAQTQTDARYKARSQIRGLPATIKLDYAEIARYLGTTTTTKA